MMGSPWWVVGVAVSAGAWRGTLGKSKASVKVEWVEEGMVWDSWWLVLRMSRWMRVVVSGRSWSLASGGVCCVGAPAICMYVWMDGWMDGWMHACVCVYIYTYLYTYTHRHTRTHTCTYAHAQAQDTNRQTHMYPHPTNVSPPHKHPRIRTDTHIHAHESLSHKHTHIHPSLHPSHRQRP